MAKRVLHTGGALDCVAIVPGFRNLPAGLPIRRHATGWCHKAALPRADHRQVSSLQCNQPLQH